MLQWEKRGAPGTGPSRDTCLHGVWRQESPKIHLSCLGCCPNPGSFACPGKSMPPSSLGGALRPSAGCASVTGPILSDPEGSRSHPGTCVRQVPGLYQVGGALPSPGGLPVPCPWGAPAAAGRGLRGEGAGADLCDLCGRHQSTLVQASRPGAKDVLARGGTAVRSKWWFPAVLPLSPILFWGPSPLEIQELPPTERMQDLPRSRSLCLEPREKERSCLLGLSWR